MANFSYSTTRGSPDIPASVTAGTSAPGAGDIEVRISDTNGITKREAKELLDRIWRFLDSRVNTTNSLL